MIKINYLFVCICLLITLSSCNKEETTKNPIITQSIELRENISFCMTTYNIHAFCQTGAPNIDVSPEEYGQEICDLLQQSNSDYVNLQEVWCSEVANVIEDCMTQAGYNGFVYDEASGLMSISRNVASSATPEQFDGPETGPDHLKDKGFIHTSFNIMAGCTVNIINTHTQADNAWYEDYLDIHFFIRFTALSLFSRHSLQSATSIRRLQLAQIKQYMMQNIRGCEITILGGDFNIKKQDGDGDLTREFKDLISLIQGQPSNLITSVPTNQGGDILDYFIISNFDQFASDIQTLTTTVYDNNCINPYTIYRYNVYETDNLEYPPYVLIVGTFDSLEEAEEFENELKADAAQNGDIYFTYDIEIESTNFCELSNPSDHEMVETCIENYNCNQDCP